MDERISRREYSAKGAGAENIHVKNLRIMA